MNGTKRVMICLSDQLLAEIDGIAAREKRNRSEFIREVVRLYILERKKREVRERLKKGYVEISHLNVRLANAEGCSEWELSRYEKYLAERE
jgi:CopG family transcriptional regulator/antitoxin EndoAI